MSTLSLSDSIKTFLHELSGIKRVSENTLKAYKKDLDHFYHFLEDKKIDDLNRISDRTISSIWST